MTKYEITAILFVIFFMFAMFWIAGIRWNFAKVQSAINIKLKTGLKEWKAVRLIKLEEDQTFIMVEKIFVL